MQAPAGSEGEEFDQRGRLPAGPEALGHGATVDGDLESPEQPDCNLSHGSTSLNSDTLSPWARAPKTMYARVDGCAGREVHHFVPASCRPEVQPGGRNLAHGFR